MHDRATTPVFLWQRLLQRGEAVVAPLGLGVSLIFVLCMLASGWWLWQRDRTDAASGRLEQVQRLGEVLSNSAQIMLAREELASLRHLITEAARVYGLSGCRVQLSDGQIVADANPARITTVVLSASWDQEAADQDIPAPSGALRLEYPLGVLGRGGAVLQITADADPDPGPGLRSMAGLGVIGVSGMFCTLLLYRVMRSQVQRLGVIQDALRAAGRSGASTQELLVSEKFGPEAQTWNRLLCEKDRIARETLRHQADSALRSRLDQGDDLKPACDAMRQGLILIDPKLCITYANGAAAAFLHTTRDQMLGAEVSRTMEDPQVLELLRDAVQGRAGRRRTVELEHADNNDPDSNVVLRFSVIPVKRADSALAMVLIEDFTQQRVADAARNTFIAQATHELRTPLTNMRLYLETALNEGQDDPKLRGECLNVVNQENRRLERLVGDMLSVAEIEAGSLQIVPDDVRLDVLFKELEDDYRALAREEELTLAFSLPPKLPVIQGSREKITLALHNVLGNALKYTPKGGTVSVQVEVRPSTLVVEVRDTGIGITAQEQEKIFEKFYRAQDKRVRSKITGTGLGLALARQIARLHGGDITVESELDKGSTFTLTLPISADAA